MNEIDLDVFTWLDVAYRALSLSVQDAVVVPQMELITEEREILERMPLDITRIYFYAEDDGEEIVRKRIREYGEDIRESYKAHKLIFEIFKKIDSLAKKEDRSEVVSHAEDVCEHIIDYANFVDRHKIQIGVKSFFNYPYLRGGDLTLRGPFIINLPPFNEEKNRYGLEREIGEFRGILPDFLRGEKLEINQVYSGFDSGIGHDDGSYRATLALTKMLFREHLGFEIE